jgi:intergrase/recombinase
MEALSALSKFLGCYDDYRQLVKAYGLKWAGKSPDDVFIERLTRDSNPEEIWSWVRDVKQKRPELSKFMDLLAFSGLRFSEGINSFNLQVQLSKEGKLNSSYYVVDKSTLEHFRFKDLFIRRSKKAFVSFVPGELVQEISGLEALNGESVKTVVRRKHLPLRFGDIREAHGTFMIRYLKKEEIDFLHGRVTSGVFMQHYFNPALVGDLKARVFQGIAEIQEKVRV